MVMAAVTLVLMAAKKQLSARRSAWMCVLSCARVSSNGPAPDSPLMTMHVSFPVRFIVRCAASASAKMCGGRSYI
jgi:hypothetical protein